MAKYVPGYVFETKHYGPMELIELLGGDNISAKFLRTNTIVKTSITAGRKGTAIDPSVPKVDARINTAPLGKIFNHPHYGDYKVLERLPQRKYSIQFLKTGSIVETQHHQLRTNKVADPAQMKTPKGDVQVGKTFQTKRHGFIKIVERYNNSALVEFLDTGHRKIAHTSAIHKGHVRDDSVPYFYTSGQMKDPRKGSINLEVGDVYHNNSHQYFEVIEIIDYKKVLIRFQRTGTEKWVRAISIRSGKINDYMEPSVRGVGYIGSDEPSDPILKRQWLALIARHADENIPSTVCERWHNFQNFCEDIVKIKNFDEWYDSKVYLDCAYQLDKDLLGDGSFEYRPDTVCFITPEENWLEATLRNAIFAEIDPCVIAGYEVALEALRSKYRTAE